MQQQQHYVILVEEVDVQPVNWTSKDAWPKVGLFKVKDSDDLYRVNESSVDYIYMCGKDMLARPISDDVLNPQITEDLFLKSIAAAANSKRLSD